MQPARTWIAGLVFVIAGMTMMSPLSAKDIKLGGGAKAPSNIVELPTIAVAIRRDDGGWNHIKIEAWLAPKDVSNVKSMESLKTSIVSMADRELPNRSFATLQAPDAGAAEAKKVIHAAAEAGIGHPWAGDVLIKTMLVY